MAKTDANKNGGEKKLGVTSWLKLKLLGKEKETSLVNSQFLEELSAHRSIGRYDVLKKAGQGSMGVVYLAKDPYIKRQVAIKVARPYTDYNEDKAISYRKRFFTEAQSAGRLSHPNIVAIYDAGMHHNFYYIAMEYIDGPTLLNFCTKVNLLPIGNVVGIIFSACKALDYAHNSGVVHRDIKPSNIMLNKTGNVKITDFGIAHVKTDYSYERGVVGSPCYMSPEQVQEKPIDEKSDIFSLGCVLYELLTGEKAFSGDNLFSIMRRISHEDPVPIIKKRPEIPEILDKIIAKALAKDSSDRYQTCMDFAYELRVALRGLSDAAKKPKGEDVVDYVHQVSFFNDFTKDQVKKILKSSNLIKVPKGKVLVSEGEIDDTFFIILSGKAVVRKDKKNIAVIKRGDCFGEMAYLGGDVRAATVLAGTDCILLKISATLLERSSESVQLLFLKRFASTLLARLQKRN